jgi:hypothetical protein
MQVFYKSQKELTVKCLLVTWAEVAYVEIRLISKEDKQWKI